MHRVCPPLTSIARSIYHIEVSLALYRALLPLTFVVASITEVLSAITISSAVLPFTLVLSIVCTHMSITVIEAVSNFAHVNNTLVTVELAKSVELVILELT